MLGKKLWLRERLSNLVPHRRPCLSVSGKPCLNLYDDEFIGYSPPFETGFLSVTTLVVLAVTLETSWP